MSEGKPIWHLWWLHNAPHFSVVFTLPAVCLCAYLNILLSLAYCFQCSTYRSTGKNIFNPRCNEAFTLIMWTKWTRLIRAAVCHNDCSKNDNIVQRNIARIFNWNIAFRDRDLVWMTSPPFSLCSSQRAEHQGGVVHGLVRHHRCPLDVWWWIHSGVIWAPVRHLHGTVQHCQWVCMAERMEVNLPQILFSWLLLDVFWEILTFLPSWLNSNPHLRSFFFFSDIGGVITYLKIELGIAISRIDSIGSD